VRALYDLRSAYLHGRTEEDAASNQNMLGLAPALLSCVIRSLATIVKGGGSCQGLVSGDADLLAKCALQDDWETNERFRIDNRFSNHRVSVVFSFGSMVVPENKAVLWSPMLGLSTAEKAIRIGQCQTEFLTPLSLEELMQIEDRDIRGDFLQSGGGRELLEHSSVLQTNLEDVEPRLDKDLISTTHATLRSTVIALRILGSHNFRDTQLLGDYHYRGCKRIRRPTVFRQTLFMRAIMSVDSLTAADVDRVGQLRDLVFQTHDQFPSLRNSLDSFASLSFTLSFRNRCVHAYVLPLLKMGSAVFICTKLGRP
jgi:hypothetical protein